MDTLVIDIETKNTFADVGGKEHLYKLETSAIGVYSYLKNEYICYLEEDFNKIKEILENRAILVGFSSNKFDIPLLKKLFGLDLFQYPRVDISDEIEMRTGKLISLDNLAKTNLGYGKNGESIMAPKLYHEKRFDELREYCLQDVKITKELYDLIKKNKQLLVPERDSKKSEKVDISLDNLVWEFS